MSHDEIGGTVTRKERRAAFGGTRNQLARRPFSASDHIRNDWTPDELMQFLEGRAEGYNGLLRNFLCTAAHQLRVAGATIDRLEKALAEEMAVVDAPVVSKRNQQPGRLSGGERKALKDLVDMARSDTYTLNTEAVMAAGRDMLAKVRKRALGGDREVLAVEELDEATLDAIARSEVPNEFTARTDP